MALGFLAASVFALVGFVLTTVVSARERRVEFALLRALGLSLRQLRRWMLIEQLALIACAVLFGTVIGIALAGVVLPLVSLTSTGAGVFPPVEVVIPWRTVAGLQATLVAGLLIGVVAVNALVRRIVAGAMLRAGGDT
jgi:ABC-type antimicrobial peptide transport system permease subunit